LESRWRVRIRSDLASSRARTRARAASSAGVGTRTAEVYDFCRLHRGKILPFKGEQRLAQPYAFSKIDIYPGTNRAIPGGIKLLRGNVTYYKNKLANKLEVAPADPGAWHYHQEVTADWARQMTAEYIDEQGLWQCPAGRDNHAWDVSVYSLVAADILGVKYWEQPAAKPETVELPAAAVNTWIPQRQGWLNR